jgi:hypothetical protein
VTLSAVAPLERVKNIRRDPARALPDSLLFKKIFLSDIHLAKMNCITGRLNDNE